jgi:hypothetical protein
MPCRPATHTVQAGAAGRLLPASLSGDLAAALLEHGPAMLDEHYGHWHWPVPDLLCRHQAGLNSANAP